jgi:hypothetical protein
MNGKKNLKRLTFTGNKSQIILYELFKLIKKRKTFNNCIFGEIADLSCILLKNNLFEIKKIIITTFYINQIKPLFKIDQL